MLINERDETISQLLIGTPAIISSTIKDNKNTINDLFNKSTTSYSAFSSLINDGIKSGPKNVTYRNSGSYLRLDTIQKMLTKFLAGNQMTRKKLAESLNISVKELNQFSAKKISPVLIRKINLPLIKLFCKTKFSN